MAQKMAHHYIPPWPKNIVEEFENKMLKTIFRPRRNEVTRESRELHSEELHTLLSTRYERSDKIKVNGMGTTCSTLEICIKTFCQKSLMKTWAKIRLILKCISKKIG
jgi:hypothetical protein